MRQLLIVLMMFVFATASATQLVPFKSRSPQFYKTLAKSVAKKHKVSEPKYLYGIWKQESKFDYSARGDFRDGKYHSWGLGQVQPYTAYLYVGKKIPKKQLLYIKTNADISGHIFGDLLKRYKGEYIYAIAAYNAGTEPIDSAYVHKKLPKNYRVYVYKVIEWSKEY